MNSEHNAEQRRLEERRAGTGDWSLWGPYMAQRAWGTVREDYSDGGAAWEAFDHDQARSRAYRWSEDGLGGICDEEQRLCFSLALWNGRDPILKERAFGLTGNQGNRGEDVKELYFYVDATPSHSWLRFHYFYPQAEYPYAWLVEENARRGRTEAPFNLLDTGVFEDNRFWDVQIYYAKVSPSEIHIHIYAYNRGPDTATLHLLPSLWFRNTWAWGGAGGAKPHLADIEAPKGAAWAVKADEPKLGRYYLYGRQPGERLFTDNETNGERLWGGENASTYVKDAFHRRVIERAADAVNPAQAGTKFACWHEVTLDGGQRTRLDLVLTAEPKSEPFARSEVVFSARQSEANVFYDELLSEANAEDHRIMRQALAGMIWCKQFFHYDVRRWLDGDDHPPPGERRFGRNHQWQHLRAAHVISMPDDWEYPWFAAWDLAFHCAALALIDVDFAKEQLELVVSVDYLHPNGQIPAYEWAFGDVNPPVHAMGVLKVFRAERAQRGEGDLGFLRRVFHKLLLNYAWWINRKDADGLNVFEGGFLGLDNISVFDRSNPLPPGFRLQQADATGWMAMFSLQMTVMALELATENTDYEDIAIQTYRQFLGIADTVGGRGGLGESLWDPDAGFFKDLVLTPDGTQHRIDVYSLVGLIPVFAAEVIDQRLLANVPRFRKVLWEHKQGMFQGRHVSACPNWQNERGEHLLALVDETRLPRILERVLNEDEFLSPFGVRSVSRLHAEQRELGSIPGIGASIIEYVPGESNSDLFGGNSNWRGPVWMPTNYALIQALEKYYRFLGDDFTLEVPCADGRAMTLREIATLIAERLVDLYRRNEAGLIPAMRAETPFQTDPHWKDLHLFYEYFHADTGAGLGAAHQTGWTGLLANLVMRRYLRDIPPYWATEHCPASRAATSDLGA